jgi:hypothetical protein
MGESETDELGYSFGPPLTLLSEPLDDCYRDPTLEAFSLNIKSIFGTDAPEVNVALFNGLGTW